MKRAFKVCLLSLLILAFSSCSNNTKEKDSLQYTEPEVNDNYRNYYEIFVRSFYDSNNDGYGDLKGVEQKLDYIKGLGFDGIWLMPVNKAGSYHKYDVIDYYDIDKEYGTLDDMKSLINSCKEKNIKLIMDLVVNHTSSLNKWFIESTNAMYNNTESKYKNYYNYSLTPQDGYRKYTNFYYEARFDSDMPDLNLDNEDVRDEINSIMKYWLDLGISGFRLDACTSYYTGNQEKNTEFLKYINDSAKSINPDAYIVGEAWTNTLEIEKYYTSGIDSFFGFGTGDQITYSLNTKSSGYYTSWAKKLYDIKGNGIQAPFIGNHDTGRSAGILKRDEKLIKFGYGLLGLIGGNSYAYYGDEIGMVGTGIDPNKRIGMLWDDDKKDGYCALPPLATSEYIFPSVEKQMKDGSSILNYYKRINYIRSKYDTIKKGTFSSKEINDSVCLVTRTYNNEEIKYLINFSSDKQNVTLDKSYEALEKITISSKDTIKIKNNNYILPGYSIQILK